MTETIDFAGIRIAYDERVLRPRPWTELQSRWSAELVADAPEGPLLELCSGAGHIGLGAAALSRRALVCVDVAEAAAELTTANARAAGLDVEVRLAPLQDALREGEVFVLAIADPPWVRSERIGDFAEDPPLAIDGGADGLSLARDCVLATHGHLPTGGSLLLQLGSTDQADTIAGWAADEGWDGGDLRTGEGGVVLRLQHP